MLRSRALFTAPVVLAVVIAGVFAIRTRDNDNSDLNTTRSQTCPPVARADAAATTASTPLSIDVLSNDTDADGDPLVFQIIKTTGGESTVDDGGTPTDASDDQILFTPANPAPPSATIEYQAVDPDGGLDEATVTVLINPEGALTPGATSEPVTAEADEASEDCGGTPTTSEPDSTAVSGPPLSGFDRTTVKPPKRSRRDRDGERERRRTTRTTRTTRRDAADDDRPPATNRPPSTDPTPTQPPATNPPPTQPPPTEPPGPEPTTPPECGPFPSNGTDEEQDAWKECVRSN